MNNNDNLDFGGATEDKPKVYIPMVNFPDFGIALQLRQIANIEKEDRYVETELNAGFKYGITINRGVHASIKFPSVDVSIWYDDFQLRDRRYEQILMTLEDAGFNIVTV